MLKELRVDHAAPWKQRYRAPAILWTQIAKATPTRGLVVSNQSGKYQLYAWDVPTGKLRQLTDRPTGIWSGELAPDGRWVYYLHDKGGNEIGHYVRIPFDAPMGEPQDITPDLPPYSSFGLAVSPAGNRVGFTLADTDGFHLCCMDLAGDMLNAPRMIYHSPRLAFGPTFSQGGEIAVMASLDHSAAQHYNLSAFDAVTGEQIAELWDGTDTSLEAAVFSPLPDDFRLLGTTNRTGVKRPLIWNPRRGERTDLLLAELEGEVFPVDWSPDATRILLCQFHQAIQQLYIYDLDDNSLIRLAHPSGTFDFLAGRGTYFGRQSEIWAQWQDSTHPSQLVALDSRTGAMQRTVLAAGDVPPGHSWKSVTFPSSDGQMIQGWLGVPESTGPFPTILHTHGGPEGVETEIFDPSSQSWLDHGFAFLSINYRGSTTFSRKFQEKIWGDLGRWEIEDMVAARDWLVKEGIAHPDQILLTGWSYGGYLTLLGLGKRPDLWAGGISHISWRQ